MPSNIPTTYPSNYLSAAGFEYLVEQNKVRCKDCGLEIANWAIDMNPFQLHFEKMPNCRFIQCQTIIFLTNKQECAAKQIKITSTNCNFSAAIPIESEMMQNMRTRSFAHWSYRTAPSSAQMIKAGFFNYNVSDRVICIYCNLICEQWAPDTGDPCEVHRKLSPDCPYVKAKLVPGVTSTSQSTNGANLETVLRAESNSAYAEPSERQASSTGMVTHIHPPKSLKRKLFETSNEENIDKRQKIDSINIDHFPTRLLGSRLFQQIQRRSFSHWRHSTTGFTDQLINAGFFSCNVADRVICIYCNLICQQWIPRIDDPCEVHRVLSPDCIYVKMKLTCSESLSIINENGNLITRRTNNGSMNSDGVRRSHPDGIVPSVHQNSKYAEIIKRTESFDSWRHSNLPSKDDFVNAGFFYTGEGTNVSCFYCNGFLTNWKAGDDPKIEHIRWFPHCLFAKQLYCHEMHRKIQESKQTPTNHRDFGIESDENIDVNNRPLLLLDENNLSIYVAARLKLPSSQHLLNQNVRLAVIKRCWEDQLRIKKQDFITDDDLLVACIILQKQVDYINGNKDNIIEPSRKMRELHEQNKECTNEQLPTTLNRTQASANIVATGEFSSHSKASDNQIQSNSQTPSNPCVLCLAEEKRLACIPCGHLATCVPCGQPLRSCPICRKEIEAFVRIYI